MGWKENIKSEIAKITVKLAEQEDAEFISSHKHIKNMSTNKTILTEHLLNISVRHT